MRQQKYGKSKEHRPNPIVTMGLFMDADGIPLAFDIFSGNQNEQLREPFLCYYVFIEKMKKEERDIALNPTQFKVPESNRMIDLRSLDENDPNVYNTVYYKEIPLVTGNMQL